MAKPRSANKFRKIPVSSTAGNSRAYGKHERAPRGSMSRAELNDVMKTRSRRMTGSNIPAKLIYDTLQPFRENFKGGLIWQRLVKHFARQAKDQKEYSVRGINDWDLNQEKSLEDGAPHSFIVRVPEGAGSWLACFRAEPCINGALIMNKSNADQAMCLLEGGTW